MSRSALTAAAAVAALLLWAQGCEAPVQMPGDRLVGTFDFSTSALQDGCGFADGGMIESFTGTISLDTASGVAYLTVGEASHRGTLDDDGHLVVTASASRTLGPPCDCTCVVQETIEARLYDEVQARAVGGCDGGVPEPPPATRPAGPDAGLDIRLVCGTIRDEFVQLEGPACACEPCAVDYALSGWSL